MPEEHLEWRNLRRIGGVRLLWSKHFKRLNLTKMEKTSPSIG